MNEKAKEYALKILEKRDVSRKMLLDKLREKGISEAEAGEEILLQGVVDCWFREADGSVTVVDFKTDRVTEHTARERAESYRPQLEAYTRALAAAGMPVGRRALWFFALGREMEL